MWKWHFGGQGEISTSFMKYCWVQKQPLLKMLDNSPLYLWSHMGFAHCVQLCPKSDDCNTWGFFLQWPPAEHVESCSSRLTHPQCDRKKVLMESVTADRQLLSSLIHSEATLHLGSGQPRRKLPELALLSAVFIFGWTAQDYSFSLERSGSHVLQQLRIAKIILLLCMHLKVRM